MEDKVMASYNSKGTGGLSGVVGNVIVSQWHGIKYIRAKPAHYHDRKSEKQLAQREKFNCCLSFVRKLLPTIRVGFAQMAVQKSAYNCCMSLMMKQAVVGKFPNVQLDYRKVILGEGPLSIATNVTILTENQVVTIRWNGGSEGGNGNMEDEVISVVYNALRRDAIQSVGIARRADEAFSQTIPKEWQGEDLELFMGFYSTQHQCGSNIVHIGTIRV